MWKGKYRSIDNTKYGKGKGKLLQRNEEFSGGKAHTNTWKLIRNILTVTNVFLNQKRVNVCEHMVKMASIRSFWMVPPGVAREESGGNGGKIKMEIIWVNTSAVSRGQNELIGKFTSPATILNIREIWSIPCNVT